MWINCTFSVYGAKWRAIRDTMSYKANECFRCGHKFEDGESIALGAFKEVGNKVLCETCAKDLA